MTRGISTLPKNDNGERVDQKSFISSETRSQIRKPFECCTEYRAWEEPVYEKKIVGKISLDFHPEAMMKFLKVSVLLKY